MILVLSINPLNMSTSNGRTIANMFLEYPKDDILNLYISGNPDLNLAHYINVSDRSAVLGKMRQNKNHSVIPAPTKHNFNKSLFKVKCREFIWTHSNIKKEILKVLKTYKLSDLFVQLGDYYFFIELAIYLAKELNLRITTFNTEDYYFKQWDFYQQRNATDSFTRHHNRLRSAYKNIYAMSEKNVFLTEDLEALHKIEFGLTSTKVIYTSSKVNPSNNPFFSKVVSYCGNLSNGRDLVLLETISQIQKIDDSFEINIYSPYLPKSLEGIVNNRNVFYKGFVNYNEIINIINSSFLNISIDGFDEYSIKDTIHAFSTKIADLLASGQRLLLISPHDSTASKYLTKYRASYCCDNLKKLPNLLSEIINSQYDEYVYKANAIKLFKNNHDAYANSKVLRQYLEANELISFCTLITTVNKNYEEMIHHLTDMNVSGKVIIRTQNGDANLESAKNYGNAICICAGDKGTSVNRNMLFLRDESEYVLFADDDLLFSDKYPFWISNIIRNNGYPDAIEFSFLDEEGSLVLRKNGKAKYHQNTKYGIWFLVLSRKAIVTHFGYKPFNELFGPGAEISCGEDSIFRQKVYKSFKNIICSSYYLGKNNHNVSTWYEGKTEKYFLDRSKAYGFLYPSTYLIFVARMKLKNLFTKQCIFSKCLKAAEYGKKLRSKE